MAIKSFIGVGKKRTSPRAPASRYISGISSSFFPFSFLSFFFYEFEEQSVTLPALSTPLSFSAKSASDDPRARGTRRAYFSRKGASFWRSGSRWRSCWRGWQQAQFLNRKQTFSRSFSVHFAGSTPVIACFSGGPNFYRT